MKLNKLQSDLFKYIMSDRQIEELEAIKARVVKRREAVEELGSILGSSEFAVSEWNRVYKEELKLELQIINLKKFQTEFMLERMNAE